ncbi:MAG: ribulose-phosphate 3-epimerase [Candidatus Omnitrophica bacterium]|nr:ribulose-phosphate 3-epimerase [Candidatus Omnitrophota bacterium]
MKLEISASILSADFGRLAEAMALCERSGIDSIHVDVMDGHFVPNITIGPLIVQAVRKYTKLPIESHLMIENPWDYLDAFLDAGSSVIGLHAECYGERRPACRAYGQYPKEIDTLDVGRVLRDVRRIRGRGGKACLVLNPGTPAGCLEEVLGDLDSVLVMSVNPGFSGQKFMPVALSKLEWLRARFAGDLAVDGGINAETAPAVLQAGANVLVTASYFFGSASPAVAVGALRALGRP